MQGSSIALIFKFLLFDAGANRDIWDNCGKTALDYAEEGWESEIAEMLAQVLR